MDNKFRYLMTGRKGDRDFLILSDVELTPEQRTTLLAAKYEQALLGAWASENPIVIYNEAPPSGK